MAAAMAYVQGVRERYVASLKDAILKMSSEDKLLEAEFLFVPPRENEDQSSLPFRVDLLTREPPKEDGQEVRGFVAVMAPAEPGPLIGTVRVEGVEAAVFPFAWEVCPVWYRQEQGQFQAVEKWFHRWFDAKSDRPASTEGLAGAIHFMSPPQAGSGGYTIEIDMGTAPVEAFLELLQALQEIGASDIRVGSSDDSDMDAEVAATLKRDDLTGAQLTEAICELLRQADPSATVGSPGPLIVDFQPPSIKDPVRAYLDNLHRRLLRTPAEQRISEVAHYIRGQLDTAALARADAPAPDLANLRPLIKDKLFLEHVKAQTGKDNMLAGRPLVADLHVLYVWDSATGMRFMPAAEPEVYGLDADEAYDRALANYLRERNPVKVEEHAGVQVARTADAYDATLLLDEAFWRERATELGEPILAAVPARDSVLFVGRSGEQALRNLVEQVSASGDHLISRTLLEWTDAGWRAYATAPPPPYRKIEQLPPAGSQPATNAESVSSPPPLPRPRKPWWKFW